MNSMSGKATQVCAVLATIIVLFASSISAQVSGSGSSNHLPLWTGTSSLGSSIIVQSGGNIGIGTTSPAAILDVKGQAGKSGGAGSPIQFMSGFGANLAGNTAYGGTGAIVLVMGGTPGICIPGSVRCSLYTGGDGGSISLQPGLGGSGISHAGHPGILMLAPNAGKVGIATSKPSVTFEVGTGHATLADSWTTRSSRRFKTNVQPLIGALAKVEQLQGVSYDRKVDGRHEIGVIAEDVDRIVPEVVTRNPETKQIEGVEYSKLVPLLIEAVKSQEIEIQRLKEQIRTINSRSSH